MTPKWFGRVLFISLFVMATLVWAEPQDASPGEAGNPFEEAKKVQKVGPAVITLLDQAKLNLPAGFVYIPQPQADQLMKKMGNAEDKSMVGLIFSENDEESWYVTIEYEAVGYIKDDDAKNWDVEKLFNELKEGTEQDNKRRREQGFRELEVVGWVEKPQYDPQSHHLVWSMSAKERNAPSTDEQTINYNTYALGREGYLTYCLVTEFKDVEQQKPLVKQLLASTSFLQGKRYEDFNSSTDKIAEYGLAGLIAGVAAKKLGLFGVIAAFLVKFAKVIVLAVIGVGGALVKFFRRNHSEES